MVFSKFPHKEERLDEDKSVINKQKGEATGGEIHGSNDQVSSNVFIHKIVAK
jgi:hypothetical protein